MKRKYQIFALFVIAAIFAWIFHSINNVSEAKTAGNSAVTPVQAVTIPTANPNETHDIVTTQDIRHAMKRRKHESVDDLNKEYSLLSKDIANSPIGDKREKAILQMARFFADNPQLLSEKVEELSKFLTPIEIQMIVVKTGDSAYNKPNGRAAVFSALESVHLPKEAKFELARTYLRRMFNDNPDQAMAELQQLPNDMVLHILKYNANTIGDYQQHKKKEIISDGQIANYVKKFSSDSLSKELMDIVANVDAAAGRDLRVFSEFKPQLIDSYQESYFVHLADKDMEKALSGLSVVTNPAVKDKVIFTLLPSIKVYDSQSAGLWAAQINNSDLRSKALHLLKIK